MTINRSQVIDNLDGSEHEVFDVTPRAALPRKSIFSRGIKRSRKADENTMVRFTRHP